MLQELPWGNKSPSQVLKPLSDAAHSQAKPALKQTSYRERSFLLDSGDKLFLDIEWKNTGLPFTWISEINLRIAAELGVSFCFPFLTCVTGKCQLFPRRREPFKSKWRMQISWQWMPSPPFQNPSKGWNKRESEWEADVRKFVPEERWIFLLWPTRDRFGSADTFMAFCFIVQSIFFLLVIFWLLWTTYF